MVRITHNHYMVRMQIQGRLLKAYFLLEQANVLLSKCVYTGNLCCGSPFIVDKIKSSRFTPEKVLKIVNE